MSDALAKRIGELTEIGWTLKSHTDTRSPYPWPLGGRMKVPVRDRGYPLRNLYTMKHSAKGEHHEGS